MKIEAAMSYAKLWREGKMIGADESEVISTLLAEIERLQEIATPEGGTRYARA